ncbi:MAG: thioredoxin domain-containing protein, partial [Candidatus Nanoarchaeia archaeon]
MNNEPENHELKADTPKIGDKKSLFGEKKHFALYGVIAVLVILLGVSVFSGKFDFTGKAVSEGTAKLDFYVMSQCPYGTQVLDAIAPVLEKFGDSVDFSVNFIANDNGDGTFDSLHGQPEVDENIRQLCAIKLAPKNYMDYIVCQNKDIKNAAANAESCAEEAGIDFNELNACFEGVEGKTLLSASVAKSEAVGASGSPTIKVNGEDYNSGRDAASFTRAICQNLKGNSNCESMPECTADAECTAQPDKDGKCVDEKCAYSDPVQFEVVVVNDKTCASCDPTGILARTRELFKGANIRTVDVSSDEGKKLVSDLQLKFVPAFLFGSKVTESYTWTALPQLQTSFEQKGEWYKLLDEAVGASHWIDAKAQAEFMKSLGVTAGDNKPQIDFYVMSYCPWGNQAEEAIEPVYNLLKGKADFKPHYVFYSNYQGVGPGYCLDAESKYCSMHGVQEANQDIREMCVAKYEGMDAWFNFATDMNTKCSSTNADT